MIPFIIICRVVCAVIILIFSLIVHYTLLRKHFKSLKCISPNILAFIGAYVILILGLLANYWLLTI